MAIRDGKSLIGRIPYDLSAASLAVGFDHLAAWRALVMEGHTMPAFAYLSLMRSALDGAVRTRWLLEPAAQSERIGRGVGAQREDYVQRGKLERDLQVRKGPATGRWKPAVERIKEVDDAAHKAKIAAIPILNHTDLYARYVFPAAQVEKLGPLGTILYRLLSGTAHAYQGSVLLSEMEILDEPQLREGTQLAKVTGRIEWAVRATHIGVLAFTDAVAVHERYAGSET